jgi:hypothetical protein
MAGDLRDLLYAKVRLDEVAGVCDSLIESQSAGK